MAEEEKPAWATRLVEARAARAWTQVEMAERLRELAPAEQPLETDSIVRSLKGWESGQHRPGPRNRKLLAQLYGTTSSTLFGPDRSATTAPAATALDIAQRIQDSDLETGTVEHMARNVEQLCTRYSTNNAEELWQEASTLLTEIGEHLETKHLSVSQKRELVTQAGWLALLVGCLEYDMGRTDAAEQTRQAAFYFGQEAEVPRIIAWAHEMTAWFAETTGHDDDVLRATRAGQEVAPATDVAVQLAGKEAEVLARRGDTRRARDVLERARQWMDALPYPDNPGNHFTIDPMKFDKVAMRVSRMLGDYDMADHYANQILKTGRRPDGTHSMPMRVADAKASLAVTALERGDIARAIQLGHEALDVDRRSLPSLRLVTAELIHQLQERHPNAEGLPQLLSRYQRVERELHSTAVGPWPQGDPEGLAQ